MFTEIEIKAIMHAVRAAWPKHGYNTHESFNDWLRKTHIKPALRPYLWGLIAARHPHRYMCYWDVATAREILQRKPGQLLAAQSAPCATNLAPEVIAEQIRHLLRLASRSRATVISGAILVVSTYSDGAASEQVTASLDVLNQCLPATAVATSTIIMVGAHEFQSLCLWISE